MVADAAGAGGEVGDAEQQRGGFARGFGCADAERDGALCAIVGWESEDVARFFECLLGDVGDGGEVVRRGEPCAAGAGAFDGGQAFIDVVAGEPGGEGFDGGVVLGGDVGEGKGVVCRDRLEDRVGGIGRGVEGGGEHGGKWRSGGVAERREENRERRTEVVKWSSGGGRSGERRTENGEQKWSSGGGRSRVKRTENGEQKWSSGEVAEWQSDGATKGQRGGVRKKGAGAWRRLPNGWRHAGVRTGVMHGRQAGWTNAAEVEWAEGDERGGEKMLKKPDFLVLRDGGVRAEARRSVGCLIAEEPRCLRETSGARGGERPRPLQTAMPHAGPSIPPWTTTLYLPAVSILWRGDPPREELNRVGE